MRHAAPGLARTAAEAAMLLPSDPLLRAMDDNLWAFWRDYGRGAGADLHEADDLAWFASDIPVAMFNAVPRIRLDQDAFGPALARIAASAARRGVPALWWVGPDSRPADLAARLERHGLKRALTMTGMMLDLAALDAAPAPPPGFRIERVRGRAMRRLFARLVAEGIGMAQPAAEALEAVEPRLPADAGIERPRFIGLLEGRPVATAVLVPAAGVAGLYAVSTIPVARGQGIGTAMTVLPLRMAREAGYRTGILQATAMAHRLYRRLGFRDVCEYRCYVMAGAAA